MKEAIRKEKMERKKKRKKQKEKNIKTFVLGKIEKK